MAEKLLMLILGLVLIAALASGCSRSRAPSGLPFEDDFSDCSRWSTDKDDYVSLGCAKGAYRVLISRTPPYQQSSRIFFSEGSERLSVEADASYESGPRYAIYGVGCWASREQGYIFAVSSGAAWVIYRWNDGAAPPQTVLAESATERAVPGFSDARTNRIRGECVGGAHALLALYVNGRKIATAEDRDGLASFPGFGFSVYSTARGTDVRFDNFAAREGTGG